MGAIRLTVPLAIGAILAACGGGGSDDTPPMRDGPAPPCSANAGTMVTAVYITNVDDVPTLLTSPPGDPRQFVLERNGAIRIIAGGVLAAAPFIDISDNHGGPVVGGGEQGLLGLAFHPDYAANGKFYVDYTTTHASDGKDYDEVAEYRMMAGDPAHGDPASARVLLSIQDFAGNHNGGMLEFGDDGFLYLTDGDGGGGGDPQRTAQDPNRLLGKMMRIDVDTPGGGREYGIPPGNPFADGVAGAPEVFMKGLRNAWRWSFDRATGDIYIGDVGQESVEEIDVVTAADAPGTDFGWSDCEGSHQYVNCTGTGCNCTAPTAPRRVKPVYEQVRPGGGGTSNWNSVIGGQVYRGACFTGLTGRYFYSDNGAGGIWSFLWSAGQVTDAHRHDADVPGGPTFIHADSAGELYMGFGNGAIYRIEAR